MSTLPPGNTYGVQVPSPCAGAVLSVHAPGEVLPHHRHSTAYVCVVLAGTFVEASAAGECVRRAGDVVLHPAGEWHADRFGAYGGRCLNLHLPEDAVPGPGVRRAGAALRAAAESLGTRAALGDFSDRLGAESAQAEIRALLADSGAIPSDTAIDRVLEALDAEPLKEWRLAELAGIAGRHPTHLARAFRARTGVSIGAWRRRRQLAALALALRCGDEPLAVLAQAHGYADQAHMTREFRRATGCTPGAWRRRFR